MLQELAIKPTRSTMITTHQRIYLFGDFQLNPDSRVLARGGERVPLGSKAFELLTYLVIHSGGMVTKEELLRAAWPDSDVEDKNLAQQIVSVRKALGDKSDYIFTVSGRGYQFTAPVREVFAEDAMPVESAANIQVTTRTQLVTKESFQLSAPAKPRRAWPYALGALVLFSAAIAAMRFWPRGVPPENYLGTVVADFTNATGDANLGRTLKRAIEIDLNQTPFLGVLSDPETVNTLGQMGKSPDTPLDPATALEVCERANKQLVLSGSIASVGSVYLLTMDATNCATGKRVASAKAEAADDTKLLNAVDTLADRMRTKLGESARSIRRYDVPLSQAATNSLEALRDYSAAQYRMDTQGANQLTVLPLYQKAVELDPQFALAYYAMAGNYYELQEGRLASLNYKKAFDLRDRVGAYDRGAIEAKYYAYGLGDALAGLSAFQAWAAMYPHDFRPWVNMSNLDNQLGNYAAAIAAGQRAIQLNPNFGRAYAVTARAYKNASRFAEAKAIAAEWDRHSPRSHVSNTSFEIAVYEHDEAEIDREVKESEEIQEQLRNYYLAQARSMEGKYAESEHLLEAEIDEDRRLNKGEIADGVLVEMALIAREYGYPDAAHAALARISKSYLDGDDVAYESAMNGDVSLAKRYLAAHEHDPHAPTDQAVMVMPRLRSVVAMHDGRFADALAALEPSQRYEMAGFTTRSDRAAIYMKMGQPEQAAADYKNILATPGSGFGVLYPMARLGLARAEAAAGDVTASRAAYQRFLGDWKDADPDLPVIKQARVELAGLH